MDTSKIKSSWNTDDSVWYVLFSNDDTLNCLDNIFNIYEEIEDFELNKAESDVASLTRSGDFGRVFERDGCIIYLIISKDSINLIIRKVGDFKKLVDKFNEYFEFVKSKGQSKLME